MEPLDYENIYKVSGQLICLFDEEGRFVKVGSEWTNILGWSADELIGRRFEEFLHPDDIEPSKKAIQDHYQDGHYEKLFINRYRKKNGDYIWLQWDGVFLQDGQLYSLARDYTYFKEQDNFFNAIQETVRIGSFRSNIDAGESVGSKGIYEIYDLPLGTPIDFERAFLNFPQPGRDILRKKVDRLISHGESYSIELPFVSEKGVKKYVRCLGRVSQFKNSKEIYGTIHDITEQFIKQKELDTHRALGINSSKMAALGEMAANIAHEINNPLSLILGKAEYLLTKIEDGRATTEEIKEDLHRIKKTSERIAKTINSLKSYSKEDGGGELQTLLLQEIIDDTLELCHERLKDLGIRIIIDEIPHVEITTRGSQLSQVLLNLISNSVESLESTREKRERWIKIAADVQKDQLTVSVIDNGPAITEEVQAKIFEPFFTTKEQNGTGLGLCISKNIIDQHKGQIRCLKGEPTTFEITLPL